ncbi:MAG: phosphohydrolase, partial [Candidatus Omnitrophota bacterium]|nr:phosphohydrolase [Candidatus Omnitrophota bacterium]
MIYKCPGQEKRDIEAEALICQDCGYEIEIFSDEAKATCPKCKRVVWKQSLTSCIGWCKYARE